jgi:hypothetical protein
MSFFLIRLEFKGRDDSILSVLVPVITTSFSKFKSRESLDFFSWEKKP